MIEIKLSEKCIHCGTPLSSQTTINTNDSEGFQEVWRPANHYSRYLEPYPVWHHRGFDGNSGAYFCLYCNRCGAEYVLKTGTLSLYCDNRDLEDVAIDLLDAEEKQKSKETSFLKWLKNQRGRGDCVGDFAFDCFYAEDQPRGYKQKEYRNNRPWPKRATSYNEWIKHLNQVNACDKAVAAFKIAWDEYAYLRGSYR